MAFTCASSSWICEASAVQFQTLWGEHRKTLVSWTSWTLWRPPNLKMPTISALPVPINLQTICKQSAQIGWEQLLRHMSFDRFSIVTSSQKISGLTHCHCLCQVFVGHLQCGPGVNYGLMQRFWTDLCIAKKQTWTFSLVPRLNGVPGEMPNMSKMWCKRLRMFMEFHSFNMVQQASKAM